MNRNQPTLSSADQASLEAYKTALRELTFNSRPIITNLTAMAAERARNISGPVSRTILDHLVFSNPKFRGPTIFLVDSICKNVGEPFLNSFVKHGLVSAFARVYGEICAAGDEGQKRDFLRVLPTWRGIFPAQVLDEINSKISAYMTPADKSLYQEILDTTPQPTVEAVKSPAAEVPKALRADTLKLLRDLKSVFESPPGPHISGIVSEIFNRLARSGQLSLGILEELDGKARLVDKREVIQSIRQIIESGPDRFERFSKNNQNSHYNNNVPSRDVGPNNIKTRSTKNGPSGSMDKPAASVVLPFEIPLNFEFDLSLLNSLTELTKLTASSDSISTAASTDAAVSSSLPKDAHFLLLNLNSQDLLVTHPDLYKVLYDDLASQCRTCALRFRDTEVGQKRLSEHLDFHFRRNMRLKEKSKRVMTKDWFGTEEDFISGSSSDGSAEQGEGDSDRIVNIFAGSADGAGASQNEAEGDELDSFVVADEDSQEIRCAVCQEPINVTWNSATEQWIYPASKRNSTNEIIHVQCDEQVVSGPRKRAKRNKP